MFINQRFFNSEYIQPAVQVDRSSAMGSKIVSFFDAGVADKVDITSNKLLALNGFYSVLTEGEKRARVTNNVASHGESHINKTKVGSVFVDYKWVNPSSHGAVVYLDSSTDSSYLIFYYSNYWGAAVCNVQDSSGAMLSVKIPWANMPSARNGDVNKVTIKVLTNRVEIWLDRNFLGSANGTLSTVNTDIVRYLNNEVGTFYGYDARLKNCIVFKDSLIDSEISMLLDTPYQALTTQTQDYAWLNASTQNIALDANATSNSSAVGLIDTQIPLDEAMLSISTATGQLMTAIPLFDTVHLSSDANGDLSANITLNGDSLSVAAANAGLLTGLNLVGGSSGHSLLNSEFLVSLRLQGQAVSNALTSANFDAVHNEFAGHALSTSHTAGAITSAINMIGVSASITNTTGDAVSHIVVDGISTSVTNVVGSLDIKIPLSGAAFADVLATGHLALDILFDGQSVARSAASALFNSTEQNDFKNKQLINMTLNAGCIDATPTFTLICQNDE